MYTLITSVLTPSDYPSAKHRDLYYKSTVCKLINVKLQCLNLWSTINNRAMTLNTFSHDTYIGMYHDTLAIVSLYNHTHTVRFGQDE